MDAVKQFNAELSSLYEVRPPISKAKMTAITRGAIKAIKFYKHVVQSVEKFILKCKAEYKVPGLYVIDSIVRQSRHQFGTDKDVFAPRFAKNMQQTFVNLYKCPPEDKSKVIRVLNLWQKNQVFAPEVIQPLFDLADPNNPIHKEMNNGNNVANQTGNLSFPKGSPVIQKTPTKGSQQGPGEPANSASHGVNSTATSNLDPATLAQLQQLHKLLYQGNVVAGKPDGQPVHFDRKLLDFDYGDDEDDDPNNPSPKVAAAAQAAAAASAAAGAAASGAGGPAAAQAAVAIDSVGTLLSNPEVLKQLQTLQNSMVQLGQQHQEIDLEKLRKLHEMKQQEDEFDKHLAQTVPHLPFASECEFKPNTNSPAVPGAYFVPMGTDMSQPPPGYKTVQQGYVPQEDGTVGSEVEFIGAADNDVEVINIDHGDSRSTSPRDDRHGASSRRRRSRSRSPRDRRSDRRSRRSRSRSRSRSRRRRATRSRERDREKDREREREREREKERKRRGLPPVKKDHLSVCSTTLWVGHLSKLVHQEDLSDTFGEFGGIVSIDLIIPRGCAFIVMDRRQDAAKCLAKLKSYKLHGKALTLAWAPGKGVKGKDLKDYWEGDLGVSYIPYSKLKPDLDTEALEDGGVIDEETLPPAMRPNLLGQNPADPSVAAMADFAAALSAPGVDTSQPPPQATAGASTAGSVLQAPPIALSLVPPFQLNRGLLNLMPNVPIGVPPPLLPNQLLGINSPFGGQGLLQTPIVQIATTTDNGNSRDSTNDNFHAEDNMDVEMEDAEKPATALSDQLLASMGSFNSGGEVNLTAAVNRFSRMDELDMNNDSRRDGRRGGRNRSRDRNRDRSRRSGSFERMRGNDGRDGALPGPRGDGRRDGSRRGDARGANNRWGGGDRGEETRERSLEERREREKRLNDRLREMANDGSFPSRDPPERQLYPPPATYDNGGGGVGGGGGAPALPLPPRVPEDRLAPAPDVLDGYDRGPPAVALPPPHHHQHHHHQQHQQLAYGGDGYDRPEFDPAMDDRFAGRRGGAEWFPDELELDFEPGYGGGGPAPHQEFYPPPLPPPRDGFRGPPRGPPRPDGFGGGGGARMMGPPRGGMFHPRGPPHGVGHMRGGPRPGPWMEPGGSMRPPFGPPVFRGGHFDGPPRHRGAPFPRPGGGGRFPQQRYEDKEQQQQPFADRNERRSSRWGSGGGGASPPAREGPDAAPEASENDTLQDKGGDKRNEEVIANDIGEGNTTPLRDENPSFPEEVKGGSDVKQSEEEPPRSGDAKDEVVACSEAD